MLQGLAGECGEEIPEDSLVPGNPCRVRQIATLDRLVVDNHSWFLLRLRISAGEKIVELCGMDG
jgi:hypothetical protein